MAMWVASPAAYRILQKSLFLPSEKLLQIYKNSMNKEPGVNEDLIRWMATSCEKSDTPKVGGIIFDEMAIQPGLQPRPQGSGLEMFGNVDFVEGKSGIHCQQK